MVSCPLLSPSRVPDFTLPPNSNVGTLLWQSPEVLRNDACTCDLPPAEISWTLCALPLLNVLFKKTKKNRRCFDRRVQLQYGAVRDCFAVRLSTTRCASVSSLLWRHFCTHMPRSTPSKLPWYHVDQAWTIRDKVLAGDRPDIVAACNQPDAEERHLPQVFVTVVKRAWSAEPQARPPFDEIVRMLSSAAETLASK